MRSCSQLLIPKEHYSPKTTTRRHQKRKNYPTTIEIANLKWNLRAQKWKETYCPVWEIPMKAQFRREEKKMISFCIISPIRARRVGELVLPYLFLTNVLTFDSLQMFSCNICIIFHHYFSGEGSNCLDKKKILWMVNKLLRLYLVNFDETETRSKTSYLCHFPISTCCGVVNSRFEKIQKKNLFRWKACFSAGGMLAE